MNIKFLTFILIGIFNTLVDIGIFTLLIFLFGKTPQNIIIFNLLSFSLLIIVAFFLNGNLTFKDKNLNKNKFIKYYLSSSFGMYLNTVIVFIIMIYIDLGTVISKGFASCIVLFYNYTMCKNYIFEKSYEKTK